MEIKLEREEGKGREGSKGHDTGDSAGKRVEFTTVLQVASFLLSPMQYLPLLAGGGLSHSLSAYFKPPPQVLLQLLMGPHWPQPPFTAFGRVPMSTHSL